MGSHDWTPFVRHKDTGGEPSLPKATVAAIKSAVNDTWQKKMSSSSSDNSNRVEQRCFKCGETGHVQEKCQHKDVPWFKVPPKGDCYSCKLYGLSKGQPWNRHILYCTKCERWGFSDKDGFGHLSKDHDKQMKRLADRCEEKKKERESSVQATLASTGEEGWNFCF